MKCQLVINDELNISFKNLDVDTRRKCVNRLQFFLPYAKHHPLYKLGKWNGMTNFFSLSGNTYINVLDEILPFIIENGYDIDIIDNRISNDINIDTIDKDYFKNNLPSAVWQKGHRLEGLSIELQDHQVELINNLINNKQSIISASTSSGKTIICAVLSHLVESYGRSIIIVPNKSLVEQTYNDYKNVGLDVGMYYGDKKQIGHKHTICTWQSLSLLSKKSKDITSDDQIHIKNLVDDVVCLIIDEAHLATGNELQKLMKNVYNNVPIRWGMTGTVPKDKAIFYYLLCSIGPVVGNVTANELMEKGILSNCHINAIKMIDTLSFDDYQTEYKFLTSDEKRLQWISYLLNHVSNTGNTLILVNSIETGKKLNKIISDSRFIYGKSKNSERKEAYDEFTDENNLKLIATYGVASTGINIPRIFNLILFEPGKSFTRVIQSIGRGIRKAKDKDFVNIWDISSTCKYSTKHLNKRKTYYKEAKYQFTVTKIDYITELCNMNFKHLSLIKE